jgi:hypothetical protein
MARSEGRVSDADDGGESRVFGAQGCRPEYEKGGIPHVL